MQQRSASWRESFVFWILSHAFPNYFFPRSTTALTRFPWPAHSYSSASMRLRPDHRLDPLRPKLPRVCDRALGTRLKSAQIHLLTRAPGEKTGETVFLHAVFGRVSSYPCRASSSCVTGIVSIYWRSPPSRVPGDLPQRPPGSPQAWGGESRSCTCPRCEKLFSSPRSHTPHRVRPGGEVIGLFLRRAEFHTCSPRKHGPGKHSLPESKHTVEAPDFEHLTRGIAAVQKDQ